MVNEYMKRVMPFAVLSLSALVFISATALADNPQVQAQVAALKQAIANNKQMIAQYAWQQLQTVSVNGDVKDQTQYQVQIGPNGQQLKTEESSSAPTDQRRFGIRHRLTEDYKNYAKQIAALAQSYAQPDSGRIQQLYQQGQVTLGSGGAPGMVALVIHNYVKQGDQVTIVFNKTQKAIANINVASYLSGPSDAVTINAQFGQLGDGTNYVANLTINGSSKNMTVTQANSQFQKR